MNTLVKLRAQPAVRVDPLGAINSVALAIERFSSLDQMLEFALDKVLEVTRTEAGSVYLLDEERREMSVVAHRGLSAAAWRDFDHLRVGEGFAGRVAETGEPIVLRNIQHDPRLTRMAARAEGLRAYASVPLRANSRIYGTLNVHTHKARQFSNRDVQLLTTMAAQIGLAVANARLYLDLLASERKFRGLVENGSDLIYLTDSSGRILYANPALQRLLGYGVDTVEQRRLDVLTLIHPADREMFASVLPKMLAGRLQQALEFRMVHADGQQFRWLLQTTVPLRDQAGQVAGMQCLAHDITERRQMQERVAQAERLSDLGRMTAQIAHEIRNPLGAIVNSIKMLGRPGTAADPRLLAIVSEEAGRLDAIISEFLLFARPPTRVEVPCDVGELVDSVMALFRPDGSADRLVGIDIRLHVPADLPAVLADPNQMRQVLWNLFSNAAEAMPGGGVVEVEAAYDELKQMVRICVTDDGPGVTDAIHVFEPFFTTKAQGTGLGLAVVARIVRDHQGLVSVENAPGRGARFIVELPAVRGAVGAATGVAAWP